MRFHLIPILCTMSVLAGPAVGQQAHGFPQAQGFEQVHGFACRWEAGPLQWFHVLDTAIDPETLPGLAHLLPDCPDERSPAGTGPSMDVEFFNGRMVDCSIVPGGLDAMLNACATSPANE